MYIDPCQVVAGELATVPAADRAALLHAPLPCDEVEISALIDLAAEHRWTLVEYFCAESELRQQQMDVANGALCSPHSARTWYDNQDAIEDNLQKHELAIAELQESDLAVRVRAPDPRLLRYMDLVTLRHNFALADKAKELAGLRQRHQERCERWQNLLRSERLSNESLPAVVEAYLSARRDDFGAALECARASLSAELDLLNSFIHHLGDHRTWLKQPHGRLSVSVAKLRVLIRNTPEGRELKPDVLLKRARMNQQTGRKALRELEAAGEYAGFARQPRR